jgi:hypothetical protein
MGLIQALARAVTAALRALASFSIRFCQQSGRWIVERVVTPAWDYFGEATSAATKAVVGLVSDTIRGVAKLPGATLRGTAAVLEGGGKLAGATLGVAAAVPGAVARGLAGGGGMAAPPAPQAQPDPGMADVRDALADLALQREMLRHTHKVATPRGAAPESDGSLEARFVHRYAMATRDERDEMDIEQLPGHLQSWLLSLDERQLLKLATSGVHVCERAIAGKRTGIVGLPIPDDPDYEPLPPRDATAGMSVGAVLRDSGALGSRIAAAKGRRAEREPLH